MADTWNGVSTAGSWFLEEYGDAGRPVRTHEIHSFPFTVGRGGAADGTIPDPHVSGVHARISLRNGDLWLQDLGSSNGTFRNGESVGGDGVALRDDDVLHFAHVEVVLRRRVERAETGMTTIMPANDRLSLPSNAQRAAAIRELLDRGRVTALFQPIVDLHQRVESRFELLGRGAYEGLPSSPVRLFEIADRLGVAAELSDTFRTEGLRVAMNLPGSPEVFFNTHPSEMKSNDLFYALRQLRDWMPRLPMTLEIHEASVTNRQNIRELRAVLDDLDMRLAYDDFGAGQARLLELVEVPPDYLKFDISLIRELDRAPTPRRQMLRTLVSMVNDMGIACVAEGIETEGELQACRDMGFAYGQGFYLGRPAPAVAWHRTAPL